MREYVGLAVAAASAQPAEDEQRPEAAAQAAPRAEYTLDNPADATVPDARFYRVQAGDGVDIVGELVVSDANELKTSYKGTLEDGTLQNRAETEEGRALVEKIAGNPDPLQVGTVQPRANNGFIWATPSGNVFIGNTRETGITQAYARGNAENVRAYMLNEAKKRGLEIPEGVENPIVHFVLREIRSKDGTAGIQDVVRLTNESVNRGMNVYEQAKNDADVMLKEKLVPGIELRADGRIDTERSAAAIGAFRRLTNAQGMIDADTGLLTEEGQTRLSNAVLAAFLASEDPTLTQKVIRDAGRLDMENERRALMRSAADLMALAEQKPQYDLRGPIAEALRYFTEWREADEAKRAEAGKTRRDWYARTKDGQRRRGIAWQEHMAQQDMFRRPSPAALIIGDLLAASRDLRSFEADDRETEAGKTRAQELVSRYLADFAQNARSANTETDDLFGAPPATVEEMLKAQRTKDGQRRFAVKAMNAAARRKDLLAVHNLDLGAIRKVAEIGGFAMPSIAVVKDSYVHSEFGDCTVLFDKSTIDPKRNRQNALYSHDAWTPTFPKIVNEINVKAIEKANDGIMASLPEDVMDALRGDNYRLVYEDGMHDAWDSAEDAADAYADNLIMKAAYLVAKGEKVEPAMRPRKYLRGSRRVKVMGEDGLRTMHERLGRELIEFLDARGEVSEKRAAELAPRVEDVIRDAVWERDYRNDPDVVKNGFTKEQCVGFMFADAHLTWDEVTDIAEAVARYENDLKAGIADKGEVDEWGTKDAIRKRVDENDPDYRAWINSHYANPILSKGVYNGKERVDANGYRRSWRQLHSEATLENIVKAMKKTQREHGSGFLGRNPFGVAVRKFKSIDDMITNEGILREMTPDEEKAVKEELSGRLGVLVSEYMASQKNPDENKFTAYDHAAYMMFDAWEASRGSLAGMKKELNGWGYSADDDLAERIWRVFDEMSVMPTNYFEAKPQREVYFNEMKAWIVPDTISADERKILDGNGQRVFTYRKDDLADRLRAVNEAADSTGTRFSVRVIGGHAVAVVDDLDAARRINPKMPDDVEKYVLDHLEDGIAMMAGGEASVNAETAHHFAWSRVRGKYKTNRRMRKARAQSAIVFRDLVEMFRADASTRQEDYHKRGEEVWRCRLPFGVPQFGVSSEEVAGGVVYDADVIIKDKGDGKFLYDVSNLKKNEALTQLLIAQAHDLFDGGERAAEAVSARAPTAESVPPSAGNVNGKRFSIAARLDEERRRIEAAGGRLLLAHHGTDSRGFTMFDRTDDVGYFFAKKRNTAASYIRKGNREDENEPGLPRMEDVEAYLKDEASGYSEEEVAQMSYQEKIEAYIEGTNSHSGIYDVALKMDDPYEIDCRGANWDAIYDVSENPETRAYDHVNVSFDAISGELTLRTREYGEDEENVETFDNLVNFFRAFRKKFGSEFGPDLEEVEKAYSNEEDFESDIVDGRPERGGTGALFQYNNYEESGYWVEPKTTRDIVSEAKDMGCDGVIFHNVEDNGGGVREATVDDVYVVMAPEQAKLVDGMTYDDDGSIIPAEKRLDWSNKDMRFSIANLYTGSASDYEKPSLHYVGTGEGNQVYGWGLYASNQRGVAETYATASLQDGDGLLFDGEKIHHISRYSPSSSFERATEAILNANGDMEIARENLEANAYNLFGGVNERGMEALKWFDANKHRYSEKKPAIYEQTFFTNREPGDESHLLSWYDPVSKENLERILEGLKKEGVSDRFKDMYWLRYKGMSSYLESNDIKGALLDNGSTGDAVYHQLTYIIGSPKEASEFLARADIDGVKYPVDSYGGKQVKDGETAGWNYVSFRDDNIRVDHKWVDGQKRFSLSVPSGPYSTDRLDVVLRGISGKKMMNDATGMVAVINSVQRRKIESNAAVRKSEKNGFTRDEHNAVASLVESLWKYAEPASTYPEGNGAPDVSIHRFVSVAKIGEREVFPYLTLKQTGTDDSRIYSIELEKIETLEGTLKDRGLSSSSVEGIVSKLRGKINNKKAGGLRRKLYNLVSQIGKASCRGGGLS